MLKDTCINVKRDVYMSKGTYTRQKRPTHVKRDLNISQETKTCKKTYTCQNGNVKIRFRRTPVTHFRRTHVHTSDVHTLHKSKDVHMWDVHEGQFVINSKKKKRDVHL